MNTGKGREFLYSPAKAGEFCTSPRENPKVPRGIGRHLKLIYPFPRNEVTPYWLSHKSNCVSSEKKCKRKPIWRKDVRESQCPDVMFGICKLLTICDKDFGVINPYTLRATHASV
jgi:hypothetical protein